MLGINWVGWSRRWVRVVAGLVVVLLLMVLSLSTWALPVLLRLLLEHQGSAAVGRTVTVQQVNWQPSTLVLDIVGLRVAGSKPQGPAALQLQHLRLDLSWQSIRQRAWVVDGLTVTGLHVRIQHQGDGHYDFDDVLQALQQPATPPPKGAFVWPRLALSQVDIQDAALDFIDEPQRRTHEIRAFTLKIPRFEHLNTAANGSDMDVTWHFKLNGDEVDWQGQLRAWTRHPNGHMRSHSPGVELSPYMSYWPKGLGWQPLRGRLAWDLLLQWPANWSEGISLKGEVAVLDMAWQFASPSPQIPAAHASWRRLQWKGQLHWTAIASGVRWTEPELSDSQLAWEGVQWDVAGTPTVAWTGLSLVDVSFSLPKRQVAVAAVNWQGLQMALQRDADGHWQLEKWLVLLSSLPAATAQATDASSHPAVPAWQWQWQSLHIQNATFTLHDHSTEAVPVPLKGGHTDIAVGPWGSTEWRNGTAMATQMDLGLDWGTQHSRLQYQGQATVQPLAVHGIWHIAQLPLHLLVPYLQQPLPFELRQADASWQGQVDWASAADGGQLQLLGDARIEHLHTHTLPPAEPLLQWQMLHLQGVHLAWQGQALTQLHVAHTTLNGCEARMVLTEDGQLNLQALWPSQSPKAVTPPPSTHGLVTLAALTPQMVFGPVVLNGGELEFIDHFIRPNYALHVTGLAGRLEAFSNQPAGAVLQPPLPARLHLTGTAQNTAVFDLSGTFNPFAGVKALDVRGRVEHLQLPPLSPYSIKYVGQGIQSGELSMQVHYQIDGNGQLKANNQLILNQLNFAERDGNSAAPNLPLRLAVALLADANGVIHVNLPVQGSLNDPEFRLGQIMWELLKGLVGKALTAPFSLLAHWLGAAAETWQQIDFLSDDATLLPENLPILQQLAHTLLDRPNLQLQLTGHGYMGQLDVAEARAQAVRTVLLQHGIAAERIQVQSPDLHEADAAQAQSVTLSLHGF